MDIRQGYFPNTSSAKLVFNLNLRPHCKQQEHNCMLGVGGRLSHLCP